MSSKITMTNRQLGKIINRESYNKMGPSEVLEILSQITIALLMVFIIAFLLFSSQKEAEIKQLKYANKYFRERMDKMEKTGPGEALIEKEKSLIEIQKQKLIVALELIEEQDRKRYQLAKFSEITELGSGSFKCQLAVAGLFVGDQLNSSVLLKDAFIASCNLAMTHFNQPKTYRSSWLFRVLSQTKLRSRKVDEKTAPAQHNEVLLKENETWLYHEIRRRIENLENDVCNLQSQTLAYLQNYYCQNPGKLTDSPKANDLKKEIKGYWTAKESERPKVLRSIEWKLVEYTTKKLNDLQIVLLDCV